jgi:hypothetical protein
MEQKLLNAIFAPVRFTEKLIDRIEPNEHKYGIGIVVFMAVVNTINQVCK